MAHYVFISIQFLCLNFCFLILLLTSAPYFEKMLSQCQIPSDSTAFFTTKCILNQWLTNNFRKCKPHAIVNTQGNLWLSCYFTFDSYVLQSYLMIMSIPQLYGRFFFRLALHNRELDNVCIE